MAHVIIVEVNLHKGFFVYHISYVSDLLKEHPEYLFFQDMLKSNIRYNISFFLAKMIADGWYIAGQSQDKHSLIYTLILNGSNEAESGEEMTVATWPVGSQIDI